MGFDDRRRDAWVCAGAAILVGVTAAVADRHPPVDRSLFAAVNHRHEPRALVVLQQMGTPWVLPGIGVAAAVAGRRRLAVAAALALPVEKALEVGLKKARPVPRPPYVEPTVLRDDAPVEGESFPSGHAAIAFAAAGLVAPVAPRRPGSRCSRRRPEPPSRGSRRAPTTRSTWSAAPPSGRPSPPG